LYNLLLTELIHRENTQKGENWEAVAEQMVEKQVNNNFGSLVKFSKSLLLFVSVAVELAPAAELLY
jgi:hypothetical protein